MQTATNYMVFKMYCKDYQTVIKKQGVKGIPPFSSPVLPDPPLSSLSKIEGERKKRLQFILNRQSWVRLENVVGGVNMVKHIDLGAEGKLAA